LYKAEVINLIKTKLAFLGTVDKNRPHVRPMKTHICPHGRIWLVSHLLSKQLEELEHNDRAELCFVGDDNNVLRLSGVVTVFSDLDETEMVAFRQRILEESPELLRYFTGPEDPLMVLHRLRVYHASYIAKGREVRTQLELAQEEDPDILFSAPNSLPLS